MKKFLNRPLCTIMSLLLCLALAGGCASQSGRSYTTAQQRSALTIKRGQVMDVEVVRVSNDSTGVGVLGGGVAGGVIGNLFGNGSGRTLATLGGALLGALGGAAVEKGVRDGNAYQITILLDGGGEVAIVQDMDDTFRHGDRVRVLTGKDGTARVQHESN
ncbi:MAG: glycine zipper 2TM domain-containing protein [Deltaproteobacteria bacterium]|nr:glycine zipper 2TM domain-containing protein [Deltaproteobacteria bacterium]